MFKDGIGRLGLLMFAGGLLAISAAAAQTPPEPGKDELRQKIAAGAETCRQSLGSAPPDITLGEVEEFCTCMGVQEAAMSEMAGADRTALRPQLQQVCVGIIRKNAQAPASPPPAAEPVAPLSHAPSAPGPAPAGKLLSWTLTANRDGAPLAYVRAVPDQMAIRAGHAPTPPIVEALVMYCRAKDSIGLRAILKPGIRESRIAINFAGDAFPLALDRQGLAAQKDWAAVAKEWEGIQKGITEADRQRPDREPHIEILYGNGHRIGGNIDLDGMPQARDRLRAQCAEAIAGGAPAGNYRTTGIEGFGEDIVAAAPPAGLAPGNSSLAPKPRAAPDCSASFERSYNALRRKEIDLAGQTGAVMQTQPRFFWNFCPIVQQEIAAAKQIIAAANACPSHRRAASIKAEATAKLAKRQRELTRPKCM